MLLVELHAAGRPQPRKTDRVRPDVVVLLQMQGVAHQPEHFESPVVQAEQGADADVVALGLHRAGDAVEPPQIIGLVRVLRMNAAIRFVVVGFLEDLIGADAGGLDDPIAVVIQRGGVQVDAADFAAAGGGRVDVLHALGHEAGVVLRMLAEDEDQPLVPLVFQGQHLLADFVLVQRAANLRLVRAAERAIEAIVRAVVADVDRREQHDAVAVNVAFQLPGGVEDLFEQFRLVGGQQRGGLLDRKRLLRQAFGDDFAHRSGIRPTLQQFVQMLVVDKIESASAEFRLFDHKRHSRSHFTPTCRRP